MSVTSSLLFLAFAFLCVGYVDITSDIKANRKIMNKIGLQALKQKYYNLDPEDKNVTQILSTKHYPVGEGAVIATFVSMDDLDQVKAALRSLEFLLGDENQDHLAPVLIFNEGSVPQETMMDIASTTPRPVGFPVVSFELDSEVLFENLEDQINRFWVSMIWKHPSIQRFDTVMRIDPNSCFTKVNEYLPNFNDDYLYYHSPFVGSSISTNVEGLSDFVTSWIRYNKEPENLLLFHYAQSSWNTKKTFPGLLTSFELSRVSFMQSQDVVQFHDYLTETEPYPMLKNKWDDSVIRFLTLSMFAPDDRLATQAIDGFVHNDHQRCSMENVENALMAQDAYVDVTSSYE